MWFKNLALKGAFIVLGAYSVALAAEETTSAEPADVVEEAVATPIYSNGAELFGIPFNDLSKAKFEEHLSKIGLEPYPSYRAGVANYSLGEKGILGIKELTVVFNQYEYVERATMSGVVEDPKLRAKLGALLEHKYGPPTVGFVRDGYGRARWDLADTTEIELHNTTFDVSVVYVDRTPKHKQASGRIDVKALLQKNQ